MELALPEDVRPDAAQVAQKGLLQRGRRAHRPGCAADVEGKLRPIALVAPGRPVAVGSDGEPAIGQERERVALGMSGPPTPARKTPWQVRTRPTSSTGRPTADGCSPCHRKVTPIPS